MSEEITPTKAETYVIWRRRNRFNQIEAAAMLEIPIDAYRELESGEREVLRVKNIGKLKPHEVCFLLRRRSKKLQREVAADLGVSRLWVIKMEDGTVPAERLRAYWGV